MKKEELFKELRAKLGRDFQLPALSAVALKLVELATDDTKSATDLALWIEKDPSLSARVLQMANSAYFPKTKPVSTIKEAIVRIGFNRLRIMALSLSLRDTFPMGKLGKLDCEKFWKVSLYRGTIARELSRKLKIAEAEEAFLSGLILEIGLLVFFLRFLKDIPLKEEIDISDLGQLISFEEENFGINHRQLGEFLLHEWKLPEHIVITQRTGLPAEDPHNYTDLQLISHLAVILSKIPTSSYANFETPYEEAKKLLPIEDDLIDEVLIKSMNQIETLADSLKIQVNKEQEIIEIMDKARKTLSKISERLVLDSDSTGELPTLETIKSYAPENIKVLEAISHEIRNPLLAVGGFAKRLAKTLDPTSKGSEYVNIILKEAERLERVLSELKELAQPQRII